MWRDMEVEAIRIGLDLHYFWSLNPKQFEKYIQVFGEKEKSRIIEVDMLNHLLGKYISIGFNDPKNYPTNSFLSEIDNAQRIMTDEEMERRAKLNTIKMGGVIE